MKCDFLHIKENLPLRCLPSTRQRQGVHLSGQTEYDPCFLNISLKQPSEQRERGNLNSQTSLDGSDSGDGQQWRRIHWPAPESKLSALVIRYSVMTQWNITYHHIYDCLQNEPIRLFQIKCKKLRLVGLSIQTLLTVVRFIQCHLLLQACLSLHPLQNGSLCPNFAGNRDTSGCSGDSATFIH